MLTLASSDRMLSVPQCELSVSHVVMSMSNDILCFC